MKTYRLTSRFVKQMEVRLIILYSIMIVIILPIIMYITIKNQQPNPNTSYIPLITVSLFLVIALLYAANRNIKFQRKFWISYQITIDGEILKKTQNGVTDITLSRNELTKITEVEGQNLRIQLPKSSQQFVIPHAIENYDEIRSILAGWHPIEVKTSGNKLKSVFTIITIALAIGLIAGAFFGKNPYFVAVCTGISIIILIVSHISIQINPNMPKRLKTASWSSILVIILFAIRFYYAMITILD